MEAISIISSVIPPIFFGIICPIKYLVLLIWEQKTQICLSSFVFVLYNLYNYISAILVHVVLNEHCTKIKISTLPMRLSYGGLYNV